MSFLRLIYYSAILGGWAAFLGWFLGEAAFMQHSDQVSVGSIVATTALCGAFIAGGLGVLEAITRGSLHNRWPRLAAGFIGGMAAGAVGSLLGNMIFSVFNFNNSFTFVARTLGFTIMGLAIGCVDGMFSLSWRRIRNGLIGGALGGFLGGLLYDPLLWAISSPMSSRAVALVLVGLFIGLLIGLAQVLLRDASLTVEEGFRPGRQLVLSGQSTSLGTSEKASLIFIAVGAQGVEPMHVSIQRRMDGTHWVQDGGSRTGTYVNDRRLSAPAPLQDGDLIRFGVNKVRFNERARTRPSPTPSVRESAIPVAVLAPPRPVSASDAMHQSAVAQRVPASSAAIPVAQPASVGQPNRAASGKPAQAGQKLAGNCLVCGTMATGQQAKRVCQNCGAIF